MAEKIVLIVTSLLVTYLASSAVHTFTASPHDALLPLPLYWADLGLRLGGTLLSCSGPCCFSGQSPGQSSDSHGEVTCVWGNFRRSLLADKVTEICVIFFINHVNRHSVILSHSRLTCPKHHAKSWPSRSIMSTITSHAFPLIR